jgi:hypothetical protein
VVKRVIAGERPAFPKTVPARYMLLAKDCWDAEPKQRPEFDDVIRRFSVRSS